MLKMHQALRDDIENVKRSEVIAPKLTKSVIAALKKDLAPLHNPPNPKQTGRVKMPVKMKRKPKK